MRKPNPNLPQLKMAFHANGILTMTEIKSILGSKVNMTVYRTLSHLSYLSSYSHAGRYYTLAEIAQFDEHGIWEYSQIYFSQFGTLKKSILHVLKQSLAGYTATELKGIFKIPVYNTVLNLYKEKQVKRKQLGVEYVYFFASKYAQQLQQRRSQVSNQDRSENDEYLQFFMSTLNEKQRRWFAGLQSLQTGYGGDKIIAQKFGLDAKTVAKGRKELKAKGISPDRIRNAGAGRPAIKKTPKSSSS